MQKIYVQHKLLKLFLLSPILLFAFSAFATHNRAGEIHVSQVGALTVHIQIITYARNSSFPVDRDSLDVVWGDGTTERISRNNGPIVNGQHKGEVLTNANDTRYNTYEANHTYPGRSTYRISMTDPNRNGGIINVNYPNSDVIPFHLETTFTFLNANFSGYNTTPYLLQPPIDKGCVGKVFVHNPNAFDPDGDSIAYRLITPLQDVNTPVPLYLFPDQVSAGPNNKISLDERTGTFIWNAPQKQGEYNIAFYIISYRGGVAIDTTIRDMQILIDVCDDHPPKVTSGDMFCVIAGQTLKFNVTATDPDAGQKIRLTATGAPLIDSISPATFPGSNGVYVFPPFTSTFTWNTVCDEIRSQPYSVVFKAVDNYIGDTSGLADLKSVQIKVVGPPPENVQAVGGAGFVTVSWKKPYVCENVHNRYFYGFSVWRRENSNPFPLDTCQPGLDGKGYTRIAFDTIFPSATGRYSYIDNNVERGKTYCYRILAYFAKRTPAGNPFNLVESLPSQEACVQLSRSLPLITNASVLQTDAMNGSILVKWTKPLAKDLDTVMNPGPYKYQVFRATGITKQNLTLIPGATFTAASFSTANDTMFVDTGLNTMQNPYSYKIAFYVRGDTLLGFTEVASSVFLKIASTDRINNLSWNFDVPWSNVSYVIYRKNNSTGSFDSIGVSTTPMYSDTGLVNKTLYCYYVQTIGSYDINGVASPLINLSQQVCATPIDTVPPCPPTLRVSNICNTTSGGVPPDQFQNNLSWTPDFSRNCKSSEIGSYKIYYAQTTKDSLTLIQTNKGGLKDSFYVHHPPIGIAGCYAVTSVDTVGNESRKSNIVCVDNCPIYTLPNTFTPNGDGQNDVFHPYPYRFIDKVDFKVFNRWGELVFQTNNPDLKWDGKNTQGKDLAVGTYYYTCVVYEIRVTGVVQNPGILSGYIELLR